MRRVAACSWAGQEKCAWLRLLVADTSGQDLIEYALLSAVVGLVAIATMNALGVTMGIVYSGWNTAVNALWECSIVASAACP